MLSTVTLECGPCSSSICMPYAPMSLPPWTCDVRYSPLAYFVLPRHVFINSVSFTYVFVFSYYYPFMYSLTLLFPFYIYLCLPNIIQNWMSYSITLNVLSYYLFGDPLLSDYLFIPAITYFSSTYYLCIHSVFCTYWSVLLLTFLRILNIVLFLLMVAMIDPLMYASVIMYLWLLLFMYLLLIQWLLLHYGFLTYPIIMSPCMLLLSVYCSIVAYLVLHRFVSRWSFIAYW